ncbi:ATP-grasp domain-containing protein [Hoeflea sp.]|uniref:ATP-grasp domain-containing protein n=1 Tax=Hoeflea sp. TaxID=1940281 RepID=UPI003B51E354
MPEQPARHSVAVTGVGALIGQGIARSLRPGNRTKIVGIDRRITGFSRSFCDAVEQKPQVEESAPAYLDFWRDVIDRHSIELILPGLSVDMDFFNTHRDEFEGMGARVVLNRPSIIALCSDKFEFYTAYGAAGFPAIPSGRPESWDQALRDFGPAPLLLKPRRGEGSSGIVRLHDADDFAYWTRRSGDNWLIQKIIGSDSEEFTIGIYGFGDGQYAGPIIMRRRLTRSGHTGEAEVVDHPVLSEITDRIAGWLEPVGPTNLQFRMEGNTAYLLEINPRFSSSCSLRTAFGFNEAEMCVDDLLEDRRPDQPMIRKGLAHRYNEDFISHAGDPV